MHRNARHRNAPREYMTVPCDELDKIILFKQITWLPHASNYTKIPSAAAVFDAVKSKNKSSAAAFSLNFYKKINEYLLGQQPVEINFQRPIYMGYYSVVARNFAMTKKVDAEYCRALAKKYKIECIIPDP